MFKSIIYKLLNSYEFEIRLEDFDFEPKPDSEIWK